MSCCIVNILLTNEALMTEPWRCIHYVWCEGNSATKNPMFKFDLFRGVLTVVFNQHN